MDAEQKCPFYSTSPLQVDVRNIIKAVSSRFGEI